MLNVETAPEMPLLSTQMLPFMASISLCIVSLLVYSKLCYLSLSFVKELQSCSR